MQARPKVKKNAALLSFEDDEGGDGDGDGDDSGGGQSAAAARIRSAHEAIDDARCVQLSTLSPATDATWRRPSCACPSIYRHTGSIASSALRQLCRQCR